MKKYLVFASMVFGMSLIANAEIPQAPQPTDNNSAIHPSSPSVDEATKPSVNSGCGAESGAVGVPDAKPNQDLKPKGMDAAPPVQGL